MPRKRDEAEVVAAEEARDSGPKLRKEGDRSGYPQVAFDPERGAHYHLDALGERVYHGVPAGKKWTADGKGLVDIAKGEPETPAP